jgi:hypothetical protein
MKRSFAVLCLFFASVFVSAQTSTQPADCASLTHQALELSGFNQAIDYLTASLSSDEFWQGIGARNNSGEFSAALKPVMQKEFSGELLRREMQARMVAHCNPEQMAQTVQRLQTPLVSRMLALEAATNSAEGQEKLRKYINIARTVPPTDDRMDALDALDASAGTSDFVTDFEIAMFRGMMRGAGAPPEVLQQIQSHRKDLKTQRQNYVVLGMNVTYHGVTRPELQQYTRELSSQPLKAFYAQVRKTFVEIVEERAQAMGRDLKIALGPPTS